MTAPARVAATKYDTALSRDALRKQLAAEGYSVFSWQDAPGDYYAPHSHPHDEYIVVHSGEITFIIAGQRMLLHPGEALILPADTIHEAINEGSENVHYFICS